MSTKVDAGGAVSHPVRAAKTNVHRSANILPSNLVHGASGHGTTWIQPPTKVTKPSPKAPMTSQQILSVFGLCEEDFTLLERPSIPKLPYKELPLSECTDNGIPSNYIPIGRFSEDGRQWSMLLVKTDWFIINELSFSYSFLILILV